MDLNQHLVEAVDVRLDSLSPGAAKMLTALAQTEDAVEVDSETGSTEAWVLAALDRWKERERRLKEEEQLLACTRQQVADLFLVKKALERELSIDANLTSDYVALTTEVKLLEEKLQALKPDWDVESDLEHAELARLAQELENAQTELRELEEKTSLCRDLPAHTELAKIKLEEAQQELFQLEEEWTQKVTNIWSTCTVLIHEFVVTDFQERSPSIGHVVIENYVRGVRHEKSTFEQFAHYREVDYTWRVPEYS